MMKKKVFKMGDLVFAKVRGYPAWPARVTGITAGGKYSVFFYGTYEVSNMKPEEMWPYNKKNHDKFGPPNLHKKGYSEGLYEIVNCPDIAIQPVVLGEGDFSGTFGEHVDDLGSDPVLVKILSTNEIKEINITNDENNNKPNECPSIKIECRIEVAERILQNTFTEVDEGLKQELKEKVERAKEENERSNLVKKIERLKWIKCERSVVEAICQIQKSMTSKSDQSISNCLENLKLLESIELKPLMVIKMPVIFTVVKRLSTEIITNNNDDIAADEVKEISERIKQKIILDVCNGMPMSLSAFEEVLEKKVIEFESRTCSLSDRERMCLTNIVL